MRSAENPRRGEELLRRWNFTRFRATLARKARARLVGRRRRLALRSPGLAPLEGEAPYIVQKGQGVFLVRQVNYDGPALPHRYQRTNDADLQ
jgi:hypothetical protein